MMKRIFMYAIAAVAIAAGTLVGAKNLDSRDNLTEIQLENIAALSDDGEIRGDQIPCFSSSVRNSKRAFVDCGDCKRVVGWEGKGTEALCTR